MKAEELYKKEFGDADSVPKESVIRLLKHFGKVLEIERNKRNGNMKVYSARINDYGHGDFERALVAANDSEEAFKLLKKEGHRIEYVNVLPNVEYKGKKPLIIDVL